MAPLWGPTKFWLGSNSPKIINERKVIILLLLLIFSNVFTYRTILPSEVCAQQGPSTKICTTSNALPRDIRVRASQTASITHRKYATIDNKMNSCHFIPFNMLLVSHLGISAAIRIPKCVNQNLFCHPWPLAPAIHQISLYELLLCPLRPFQIIFLPIVKIPEILKNIVHTKCIPFVHTDTETPKKVTHVKNDTTFYLNREPITSIARTHTIFRPPRPTSSLTCSPETNFQRKFSPTNPYLLIMPQPHPNMSGKINCNLQASAPSYCVPPHLTILFYQGSDKTNVWQKWSALHHKTANATTNQITCLVQQPSPRNNNNMMSGLENLDTETTARIVLDVQPEYWTQCDEINYDFPDFPLNCAEAISTCRRMGIEVIFVRAHYSQKFSPWLKQFRRMRAGSLMEFPPSFAGGFASPIPGELVTSKAGWNAVSGSSLVNYLVGREISNVLLLGLITSICVHHSAFGLFEAGFRVTLIEDACADRGRDRHEAVIKLNVTPPT